MSDATAPAASTDAIESALRAQCAHLLNEELPDTHALVKTLLDEMLLPIAWSVAVQCGDEVFPILARHAAGGLVGDDADAAYQQLFACMRRAATACAERASVQLACHYCHQTQQWRVSVSFVLAAATLLPVHYPLKWTTALGVQAVQALLCRNLLSDLSDRSGYAGAAERVYGSCCVLDAQLSRRLRSPHYANTLTATLLCAFDTRRRDVTMHAFHAHCAPVHEYLYVLR